MQALAGALSFPNGAAMVREAVPQERRGAAFGMIGMATGVAAASGPPLGGLLVHGFGWAAIFWANVPVIAVALVLGWRSLPKRRTRRTTRPRFDMAGTALLASSMTVVILVPTLLKFGTPLLAIGAGCLGLVIGWIFVRWELRARSPVVDVRLFSSPQFAAACAAVGLGNLVMYTTLLALPLYLEVVLHRSVQASGFVLVALSALSALCGPIGGRWTDRAGRWMPAMFGGVAMLVGVVTITSGVGSASVAVIVAGLAIMGIGLGVSGAPIQTAAVESVPIETTGSAAGIFSTSRYLGSVLGSSILAALFAQHSDDLSSDRFLVLFAGLSVAALGGIFANSRIAGRQGARGLSIERAN
jgi:MFS family permease